jgi:hypothetical protein
MLALIFYRFRKEVEYMFHNGRRFTIFFAIGAIILIIGLVLQWYPTSIVDGLKTRLTQSGISQDEITKIQGEISSWDIWQITTFQPLSSLLFAVGIIVIVYSVVQGIFAVTASYKVVKKQAEKE